MLNWPVVGVRMSADSINILECPRNGLAAPSLRSFCVHLCKDLRWAGVRALQLAAARPAGGRSPSWMAALVQAGVGDIPLLESHHQQVCATSLLCGRLRCIMTSWMAKHTTGLALQMVRVNGAVH